MWSGHQSARTPLNLNAISGCISYHFKFYYAVFHKYHCTVLLFVMIVKPFSFFRDCKEAGGAVFQYFLLAHKSTNRNTASNIPVTMFLHNNRIWKVNSLLCHCWVPIIIHKVLQEQAMYFHFWNIYNYQAF